MTDIFKSLVVFLLLFMAFFPLRAFGETNGAAVLKKTVNQVEIRHIQVDDWHQAVVDSYLYNQDTIRTLKDSRAEVAFSDLSLTRLAPLTSMEINIPERSVKLDIGKIFLWVFKGGKSVRVITPAAVAATMSEREKPVRVAALSLEENSSCRSGRR